ncbi:MAG TPA: 2OG-Fe dioxygenase family protein, partial [Archangium sp.]|nr:2OG-Fe dioxygenase family protein [Archangium sp.]
MPTASMSLSPPLTPPAEVIPILRDRGYAILGRTGLCELVGTPAAALEALHPTWDDLPLDTYLRDGGRYRSRRHSCFVVEGVAVTPVPHRAHWQPVEYNALHGGLERWFEPMTPAVVSQAVWPQLLRSLAACCSALKGAQPWFVEAHQFRIDTTDGIGRPT